MTLSAQGDVTYNYSCRCLNVTISAKNLDPELGNRAESDYVRAFVGENGIRILHHCLTIRTRSRAQKSPNSTNTFLQPLTLSCLACSTLVYRIVQEIPPGAEAREGPVVPTEDWVEQETLQSKSGWIEIFVGQGGGLIGQSSIEQHMHSLYISSTFSIGILTPASTPASSQTDISPQPSTDSHPPCTIPDQILPPLAPLFPPPPFTPSHPIFNELSTRATVRSTELRLHAEEETKRFIRSQLDLLEKEEAQLRADVEGIWRGYREGWKQMMGKVKAERRLVTAKKLESTTPTTGAKSGVPMSIRDFSPVGSHPQLQKSSHTLSRVIRPPSPSLLSASLVNGGAHLPTTVSQTLEQNTAKPQRAAQSSESHTLKSPIPMQQTNGSRSPSLSISIKSNGDTRMPGAFKRNMDTSVDVASSVAWVKGEEEMRLRLEGADRQPEERARNRASKKLGIGALEKAPNPHPEESTQAAGATDLDESAQHSGSRAAARLSPSIQVEAVGPSASSIVRSPHTEVSDASSSSKKAKRKVTFDVLPNADTATDIIPKRQTHVPEVELFDLDDLSSTDPTPAHVDQPQPVTRTPSYKLHANDNASSTWTLQPASMPAPRMIQHLMSTNGTSRWTGGSLKRSVDLADALPLLSSSVPAGDRVLTNRSISTRRGAPQSPRIPSPPVMEPHPYIPHARHRAPSPAPPSISNGTFEPAEAELKQLLAAAAPSHRHAWREGGRAWEMFHQRSRIQKKLKGTIAEEGSEDDISSVDDSEKSSDDEDETNGRWRNPSRFASSLPVQIHPLAGYKSLEPKTSLAERQGILVPPLKANRPRTNSATAFRKAVYAERDRIRSIDPGPALDFDEQMEDEEDLNELIMDGERGRRHALSILQARSVVPEAGMWRSMAS